MRDLWAAVALTALLEGSLWAQTICPPHSRWQGSFGAGNGDHGSHIVQLADGGFVIGGSSYDSSQSTQGNKTAPSYGWDDFYLVRIDAQGQKLWDRTYGGLYSDYLAALEQTSDGGFLLAGTIFNGLSSDFWVVRTDADGNKLWDRFFNGAGDDYLNTAKQTADGGFIFGGSSRGSGLAQLNFWIIRIDSNGNKLWDASFGGDRDDALWDIELASDGGFFLGGRSLSDVSGSRTAPSYGNYDYWLVRVDANGTKLWDRAYGGSGADYLMSLASAPNGDLFLAGESWSGINGNKTVDNFGANDFWTLRVDVDGNIVWQSICGGASLEYFGSATVAGTNGVILCGESYSTPSGSKTSQRFGHGDAWIVRIDASGNQIWDASFGTSGFDDANQVIPTADGGYAMIGSSDFLNGNKTSPHFGGADMWVVKLDPENPDDCDNDGVPNALDLCGDTPFGSIVNSNGCAVTQICPCQGWPEHADYVACVERVSAEFENAGLITSAGRAEMVADAQAANCPPSVVIFGLVHVLTKDTIVRGGTEQGYVEFTPGTNYPWGASVLLGEADSGIFIDPDAGGWGSYDDGWFLDGMVYGRFQDGSNGLIVTVHATKPALETYPVDVDFSPLGPTSITIQQIDPAAGVVVDEESFDGAIGSFTINTATDQHPRVNPFWRMPDGSVGALFEFYPDGDDGAGAIFVRANNPLRKVDHVSRVEVLGSGNYDAFSFMDERLGMFGNRHRIVGDGHFHAAGGRLSVSVGAIIEFYKTSHFEADFLPIDVVATNETGLLLTASHGGSIGIVRETNTLILRADFYRAGTGGGTNEVPAVPSVEVKAFRNGIVSGSCLTANNSIIGQLTASNQSAPQIIGCIATASSNSVPTIAFGVDRLATFICTNGTELAGTHFQISYVDIDPQFLAENIYDLNIVAMPSSSFTITAERSGSAQPRMSIVATDDTVTLTWPDNTRLFRLESSPTIPGGFSTVSEEPNFVNNQNEITLPREATGSRFFRLRSGPD